MHGVLKKQSTAFSLWIPLSFNGRYARNNTERSVIRHIIDTAVHEQDRIKFEKFGKSSYRSREVGEAMRALEMARVIRVSMLYPSK